ncbi:hypothetical protein B0H13DRAFT_1194682 [Mycena leptocephala]|nr:hypothetical protein B0H13DRAFT_84993 [Mycena leptocephala]KAJ7924461.1 hypothetical protein B0H13DRAFT_1194682 [Mycena leptocephala]
MPGKHVHFSEDVVFPPTPSPSYSVTSLPSSYGPFTPPQNAFNAYLPSATGVALHCVLASGPNPYLFFDVTLPHQNVKLNPNIPSRVLYEPATTPPLPSLVILNSDLRWRITIQPMEGKFVRVIDVLSGIYTSLRQQATSSDFEALPPIAQRAVTAAFTHRWTRIPDHSAKAVERSKGLKRVDFLGGKVTFAGLSPSQMGNCWTLTVT